MAQVLCFYRGSGTAPRAGEGSGRIARGLHLIRRKAWHSGGRHDLARPAAGAGRTRHGWPRPRVRAPWHGHLDGRDGTSAHGAWHHRAVVDRHRSREFVEFLRGALDKAYPKDMTLRLIPDNHSRSTSPGKRTPGSPAVCPTGSVRSSSCSRPSTPRG